jgi:hypothetical protein
MKGGGVTSQEDLFLCEDGPYGRRPIAKMWCNTRTLSSKGKPFLNWSFVTVTISPSNHMTQGDSPAAAQRQKRERDNDGQFPFANLNGTRGDTTSHHTSQKRENL